MVLVYRIAAAVVIGLLAYQLYLMNRYPPDYYEQVNDYNQRMTALEFGISDYFRQNGELPDSVAALDCSRLSTSGRRCADRYSAGVYYIKTAGRWASLEPYLRDDELRFRCRAVMEMLLPGKPERQCSEIDDAQIPQS